MIRFTSQQLFGGSSHLMYKAITKDESFRRSEESACRISEAVIAANDISTARVPLRCRELYLAGCKAKCQNDPETARRAFEEALEALPPAVEFERKRSFIEGEIRQLPQALRGHRLYAFMWKGITGMAIPTAVAFSLIRKQQQ